ncbi:MAG: TlpA family protein disulfide reductase [Myxococcales bacterium]|jgi:cytochrome c biogenesis protein CcmG/thiol:disulfide interchange protein DsbE
MSRAISLFLSGALILAAADVAAQAQGAALPGVGADAPLFALPVYNPEAAGLSRAGTMLLVGEDSEDEGAKLIVVSFMASHCKPCLKELPLLQRLHKKHYDRGLRIIGVSIDSEPEGQKRMSELITKHKVTFPVARDQYNFTARRYLGTKVPLPSVFILDRSGAISFVSRGYDEKISKTLVATIEQQLGVTPSGAEAKK